jgi:hypothetical protein
MLHSITEVNRKIATGKPLLLAGSEEALRQLTKGNWIGGTIPYFMDEAGGVCSESLIFVTELPAFCGGEEIREYTPENLLNVCKDAPENGVSFIIIPAGSAVHSAYAQDAPGYEGLFVKPVVGWISGVHLSQLGKQTPKVFNGVTGAASSETAVVMHVSLPANKLATLDIVNVFKPGSGDTITFPRAGFAISECAINGKLRNFAEYMTSIQQNSQIPLTADYNTSIVNVSVQSVDEQAGVVNLYAPVFPGMEYKFGAPVTDYLHEFSVAAGKQNGPATFSCNCILNYLYAGLEGKHTGNITGPITFGEIAHQLLNQTVVRLFIRELA